MPLTRKRKDLESQKLTKKLPASHVTSERKVEGRVMFVQEMHVTGEQVAVQTVQNNNWNALYFVIGWLDAAGSSCRKGDTLRFLFS